VKPKIKWAGAPPKRKRRAKDKVKSKAGRPRRRQPSEEYIKTVVRPWIPSALLGNQQHLAVLRGSVDDLTIAEEANKFLAEALRGTVDYFTIEQANKVLAATKKDGRRVNRDDRIAAIADWLKMDVTKLKNWLNRAKTRVR
jgi:hypothetical protein